MQSNIIKNKKADFAATITFNSMMYPVDGPLLIEGSPFKDLMMDSIIPPTSCELSLSWTLPLHPHADLGLQYSTIQCKGKNCSSIISE